MKLSVTEALCMDLLAAGKPRREIAKALGMTVSTASTHLMRARNKLGGQTIMHAGMMWAMYRIGAEAEYLAWRSRATARYFRQAPANDEAPGPIRSVTSS